MNLLQQAIRNPDLDAALAPIMKALGIETGDLAGQFFSGLNWNALSLTKREDALAEWLLLESQASDEYDTDGCTNPLGHSFVCTGTIYGGDDERWHGEGRCYCIHCGADGDS